MHPPEYPIFDPFNLGLGVMELMPGEEGRKEGRIDYRGGPSIGTTGP